MTIRQRCPWCGDDPLYVAYHDTEWGRPVFERQALFERFSLEAMQAGLSWLTVLRKRERMRERFYGFDPDRLARAGSRQVESWLKDAGLIRHRGKLESLISNARCVRSLGDNFGELLWESVGGQPLINHFARMEEVPTTTDAARALSKRLKALGFRFVGPTMCYALMQSAGMVNDHLTSCDLHPERLNAK